MEHNQKVRPKAKVRKNARSGRTGAEWEMCNRELMDALAAINIEAVAEGMFSPEDDAYFMMGASPARFNRKVKNRYFELYMAAKQLNASAALKCISQKGKDNLYSLCFESDSRFVIDEPFIGKPSKAEIMQAAIIHIAKFSGTTAEPNLN